MACIEIYGSSNFRHVLALSILSQKPVKILDIRSNNIEIGITEYETNLLQLIDKIMNGSTIQISSDGTSLFFKPGTLIGGTNHHKCSVHRSIGYYLEFVTWILVLLKNKLTLTLEGITNGPGDPSVDALKISTLNLMKKFGFSLETNINILKRGYAPLGGGACVLTVGPIFSLNPLNITDIGQFKNFRGISYSMRVSPKVSNQLVDCAKIRLLKITPDVYINTDHCKSFSSGLSPGYGVILWSETTTGLIIHSEYGTERNQKSGATSDAIAEKAVHILFQEIFSGNCVDTFSQTLLFIYMAISPPTVSRAILSHPSPYIMELIRLIKKFFGVIFKISPRESDDIEIPTTRNYIFSCSGVGLKNYNKSRL